MPKVRKMSELTRLTKKDLNAAQREMSMVWGVAAFEKAVDVTPTRGDTKWATGRARSSIRLTTDGAKFDPGVRPVYPKPKSRLAISAVKSMRLHDNLIFNMGVPYAPFVVKIYDSIVLGAKAGEEALERAGNNVFKEQ
jgi:hypothetical protein